MEIVWPRIRGEPGAIKNPSVMVAMVVGSEYSVYLSLSGHNFISLQEQHGVANTRWMAPFRSNMHTYTQYACSPLSSLPVPPLSLYWFVQLETVCIYLGSFHTVLFLRKKQNKNVPSVQHGICCFYSKLCPILSLCVCVILRWVQYDLC